MNWMHKGTRVFNMAKDYAESSFHICFLVMQRENFERNRRRSLWKWITAAMWFYQKQEGVFLCVYNSHKVNVN